MAEPGNFKYRERWQQQIEDDPKVTEGLLAAALVVSHAARRDGTRALMSNRQLAQKLGVSLATAERRTRELRELGYLEVVEKGGRRGNDTITANVYDLSQPLTQMMDSGGSQPLTHMRDRDAQMTEISTPQTHASIPQTGASTPHPDEGPPFNPSSIPNGMECISADATMPNRNTKKPFPDWRAEDEDLFLEIMEVDHVTYEGHRHTIDALYQGLRNGFNIQWPGRYCQEINDRDRSRGEALDQFLDAHYPGMNRWAQTSHASSTPAGPTPSPTTCNHHGPQAEVRQCARGGTWLIPTIAAGSQTSSTDALSSGSPSALTTISNLTGVAKYSRSTSSIS
jgi:DNA-binding transcriptional regulator YhcF (GntR family)